MKDSNANIVIIGMGFLATYIMPCYQELLGDGIGRQAVGIKGSGRNLEAKQAECPFPVIVGQVKETLMERRPDIIVLAVRPGQIASMTEGTLKPYYEFLREQGEALPDLYSFAPDPMVPYFGDVLGEDVNAANMIPNMIRSIDGIDTAKVGVSFVAFDSRRKWPEENRRRALAFLEPTGTVVEIPGKKAIPFLSLQVACHLMFEFNYIVQDVMAELGRDMALAQSAGAYRTRLHRFFRDSCTDVLPCSDAGLDSRLTAFMDLLLGAWRNGVMDFAEEEGIPAEAADRMICGTMESYQMEAQLEPKEVLVQNTKNHATPGGFLEMCLITFQKYGYQYLTNCLRSWMKDAPLPNMEAELSKIAHDVAKAVSDHGKTVSGVMQS